MKTNKLSSHPWLTWWLTPKSQEEEKRKQQQNQETSGKQQSKWQTETQSYKNYISCKWTKYSNQLTDCKTIKKEKKKKNQDQLHASFKRYTLNPETKINSKQKDGKRCITQTVVIRKWEWLY